MEIIKKTKKKLQSFNCTFQKMSPIAAKSLLQDQIRATRERDDLPGKLQFYFCLMFEML